MKNFKKALLKTKKVSIWGIGYLGYTTIVRLQENGFSSTIYDFKESRLDELVSNMYPNKEQCSSWSKNGEIPSIDVTKIEIAKDRRALFENKIHIVSFPSTENTDYSALANLFIENRDKLQESLIIFQSAGIPKSIENDFCSVLKAENIDIEMSTVFRSDWTVEDFFNKNKKRVISANNKKAIYETEFFLELLGLETVKLNSIEEAEIYENAKTAFSYTTVAFFNQLSLAYPHIDVNTLSNEVLKNINFDDINLGVNGVDYKSEQSIENLLKGSTENFLTILQEANSTNLSFLFYYINLLKSKNINSVTIFGLSSSSSLKDIRFSPSVILAQYLNKEKIKVYIHDENFDKAEISEILPFCTYIDIDCEAVMSDTVIVMNLCNEYKYFTQEKIEKIGMKNVKYILDNTGFFKFFTYHTNTFYHHLCDGSLVKVLN